MKHTKECAINSNVGIPANQKDESYCDCYTPVPASEINRTEGKLHTVIIPENATYNGVEGPVVTSQKSGDWRAKIDEAFNWEAVFGKNSTSKQILIDLIAGEIAAAEERVKANLKWTLEYSHMEGQKVGRLSLKTELAEKVRGQTLSMDPKYYDTYSSYNKALADVLLIIDTI